MTAHGLLIGRFAPLTQSHLQFINDLAGKVDALHIVALAPNHATVTAQDTARWLQVSYQGLGFIHIHTLASLNLTNADTDAICQVLNLDRPQLFDNITPTTIHFETLAPACRYFYSTKIAIVGGESSGKTTLIGKLAGHFGADVVPEMGRLYAGTHLGGTEVGLQYSDYTAIATNHATAIYQSCQSALTLIDTDFITTQVFCEVYENKTHPVVNAFIDEFYDDNNPFQITHTIYLDNNVKWVADGMRRLGNQRSVFAQRLLDEYATYDRPLYVIDSDDYHQRYLKTAEIINDILKNKTY
ncbi:multifunctional transcriptional regulator/nicotinamide-nucleotide adenylyltransferase/ribosylnicotinamide kinase NadR [Moraxella sp. ZY200743]|uniref:multifunctional transcriptional regulator/nicotinamide-nucleotide adenylyltransferase/ribosylnicotinamide kinase NadR n=1 Tax=Moraxella sp. ZY200743 TaxID=2911970 RepID=UPI003D7F027D